MKFGRGRKNSASPTSSIISRVFPVSWLSRFRRPKDSSSISEKTNSVTRNNQRIGELHSFPAPKMSLPDGTFCGEDRVEDDGAYWRISFSRDARMQQGRRSTGGINPLWNDAESDPEFEFPVSSFKSLDLGFRDIDVISREEGACPKFNDMVSDIKRTKERLQFPAQLQDGAMIRSSNDRIGPEDSNSIKLRYRIAREKEKQLAGFDDGEIRASIFGERDIFPVGLDYKAQTEEGHVWSCTNSNARKHPQIPNNVHPTSIPEIKVKPAELHGSRRTRNKSRGKAYSPRSEFRIRALEEIKRGRMNNKGAKGEEVIKGKAVFDSFAVAKNSYDPQKDFRDSMVQMIREKGIWRSEDLEELLASYLTVNCDEYHDLIIKVFRQVWFEIGGEWHGRRCFNY